MKQILFPFFLIFISTFVLSQNTLKVKVIDAKTAKPLPFATIYLQQTGIGENTNMNGEATFTFSKTPPLADTIVCSYLGYEKQTIPVFRNGPNEIAIQLIPSKNLLKEVDIVYEKPLSVKRILKNTLKNTKKNYSQSAVNFEGFYRETMQEDSQYVYLNEAIVDLYYTSYPQKNIDLKNYKKWQYDESYAFEFDWSRFDGFPNQFNTIDDKVRIIEARSSANHSPNGMNIPITGHPLSLTAKDYIKYRCDFLNPKTMNNYTYEKKGLENVNGRKNYVIHFQPKPSNKKVVFNHIRKNQNSIYAGNLYIDKETFAITRMEYQLIQGFDYGFYEGRAPLDYTVIVDYQKVNAKWYLSMISLNQTRVFYSQKTKKSFVGSANQTFKITEIDTIAPHMIPDKEEWKHTRQTQLRNYETAYNQTFWVNYEKDNSSSLRSKLKTDLEKNTSLEAQFINRFKQKENLPIPIATKKQHTFHYPIESLEDEYQWMANEENHELFFSYIEKENEYAENAIIPNRSYAKNFFQELDNFYIKDTTKSDQNYKKGDYLWDNDSLENLLLYEYTDSITRYPIFNYTKFRSSRQNCDIIGSLKMSSNRIAVVYSNNGGLDNTVTILKKEELKGNDSLTNITSFEWFNDSLLLYGQENKSKRCDQLFCRNINTLHDSLLFFEEDRTFDISVSKTTSYVVCEITSQSENEIHLSSVTNSYPIFQKILSRKDNVMHELQEHRKSLYLLTNDNAPNFKICEYKDGIMQEVVPHNPRRHIKSFAVTEDYYILKTYKNSFPEILFKSKTTGKWKKIDFGRAIFDLDMIGKKNNQLALFLSDPRTPQTHYEFDLKAEQLVKKKTTKIAPQFAYILNTLSIKREWAKATDKTKIPLTIIKSSYPKRKHKGLILIAYGSYGSMGGYDFSSENLILLKNGYTIVYAHVRGGGEMGSQWYTDGKLLQKENTFNDYISCAEYLIDQKYTTPDHLIGYGQSAGGLLMGVAINRRPELFQTVILDHPYLDALTTMMMDTLPLTTDHYKEVGNPKETAYYHYMKNYSPYQNIRKQDYPNLLFIAGSNDYQTPAWQVAKYVAKVRAHTTGSNKIIFRTDIGSGHSGSRKEKQWIRDLAYKNAFIHSTLF